MLYNQIINDMKTSMKTRDKDTLSTLRLLKSAIDLEAKNKKITDISDELIIEIVSRQIKTHKASIEEFEKASRDDLITKLKIEINLLEKYLPEQLSEEEINIEIDKVFNNINPTGKQDMGKIMKELNCLKGKADFKLISKIVNQKLNDLN